MANDIDFEEIKKEYVSGSGSLRELAEKFGITYSSIANRSKKDGWVMIRFESGSAFSDTADEN